MCDSSGGSLLRALPRRLPHRAADIRIFGIVILTPVLVGGSNRRSIGGLVHGKKPGVDLQCVTLLGDPR